MFPLAKTGARYEFPLSNGMVIVATTYSVAPVIVAVGDPSDVGTIWTLASVRSKAQGRSRPACVPSETTAACERAARAGLQAALWAELYGIRWRPDSKQPDTKTKEEYSDFRDAAYGVSGALAKKTSPHTRTAAAPAPTCRTRRLSASGPWGCRPRFRHTPAPIRKPCWSANAVRYRWLPLDA
jgi:hypothetical protein